MPLLAISSCSKKAELMPLQRHEQPSGPIHMCTIGKTPLFSNQHHPVVSIAPVWRSSASGTPKSLDSAPTYNPFLHGQRKSIFAFLLSGDAMLSYLH
jgi:hypothetical protein